MNMNKIKKYISSQANQVEIRNTGAVQIKSNWWRRQQYINNKAFKSQTSWRRQQWCRKRQEYLAVEVRNRCLPTHPIGMAATLVRVPFTRRRSSELELCFLTDSGQSRTLREQSWLDLQDLTNCLRNKVRLGLQLIITSYKFVKSYRSLGLRLTAATADAVGPITGDVAQDKRNRCMSAESTNSSTK